MVGVGTVVDAAIGWLVEGILGSLFTEKLVEWTQTVGLADDVEKLKSAVRYVQIVLAAAKGRKIMNEPLAQSLGDLKDLLYDAEDVMDDLDYYRLQEQVTSTSGATDALASAHDNPTSSAWSFDSIQQLGSSLLGNFGNFISTGDSKGKRKREDNDNIAPITHLGNKRELSCRIKQIAGKLREVSQDVSEGLKIDGLKFTGTSNLSPSAPQITRLTASYIVEPKVYGRDAELASILKLMTNNKSNGITVLPIVGIGGVGKTTLAQLAYNDPAVGSHFDVKIWVCVSHKFDVIRLTREILDYVSEDRQVETCNLNKLQVELEENMESKRFLIVLDDVWDDMNEHCWNKLLAPLKCNQAMGNLIIVTTRELSVAEMTQTVESVKLNALEGDVFWQLFESCAFGDKKYVGHPGLYTIGKQIAQQLRGNPLAAKTVGALLKRNISIDNWTDILDNEEWKSLQNSGGIMPALKLSYDYLPDHLQQCFRYCCLFPKDYHFHGAELVRIWISQGFVHGGYTGKKLEDTGKVYLVDLVNAGFFQQVKRIWDSSKRFVMHDLMHDLAWKVSRSEFVTIDGSGCEEIMPTVRHLSVITDSTYLRTDRYGNAFPCGGFDKTLLQVTLVRKLRSLVLIGRYSSHFFKYYHSMFKEAKSLRFLQISASCADFASFISNLVNCTHIRYIMVSLDDWRCGIISRALMNLFHLQVLDFGYSGRLTLPSGINNLVSLRHLVTAVEVPFTIANIGNMTALQELPIFKVQNTSGFDIRQIQSMNQLVELGIYHLENVRSKQEAGEARLTDKVQLEELLLSWDAGNSSSGASTESAVQVLEGLKPHRNLKHLQITGYNGSISPSWLGTDLSLTSLQLLHLENCKVWRILPPLSNFPLLSKLKLINMCDVVHVTIPCLEELVLSELPRLKKCVATFKGNLTCHLRVLKIENCPELKDFTPFTLQNFHSFEVERAASMSGLEVTSAGFSSAKAEQKVWLSGLHELSIRGCPHLMVLHPLPPAGNTQVSVIGLSTHPRIYTKYGSDLLVMSCDELRMLDDKILAFQNLMEIKSLHIEDFPNLVSLPFEGFRQLVKLRNLVIVRCGILLSSCTMPSVVHEDSIKTEANCLLPPLLRCLKFKCCGIAGKWLTEMLLHVRSLEELHLYDCPRIKSISTHCPRQREIGSSFSSYSEGSEGHAVGAGQLAQDELLLDIPTNVLSTLTELNIRRCPEIEWCGGFGEFTSLKALRISDCPLLLSSAAERFSLPPFIPKLDIEHLPRKLQPYFPANQTSLVELVVEYSPVLQSLRLHSCTTLELLSINCCEQLAELEGLQCLRSLRSLKIDMTPEICSAWIRKSQEQQQGGNDTGLLPPSLEQLQIHGLQEEIMPCFLAHLPSLSQLKVGDSPSLTSLQLGGCTALQELRISSCRSLASLEGWQCLRNLRQLELFGSFGIPPCLELLSQQEVGFELCHRLESLSTDDFSVITKSFFKQLTSLRRLQFIINTNFTIAAMSHFTDEQEEALRLLISLQNLRFSHCQNLADLPSVLHSLPSLKILMVSHCPRISRLPEKGLPPSLEALKIMYCSAELREQCRMLATEKPKLKVHILPS